MDWLNTNEALTLLGTQPQTLYANVSRGRIKAKRDPNDSRKSLYRGDDVRRLAKRAAGRRRQETVAAEAIRWGEPVMPSSLSTIEEGRLLYRGQDAVELSERATLEQVAALLWEVDGFQLPTRPRGVAPSLQAAFVAMAERAAIDAPSIGRSEAILRSEAISVLATLASSLVGGRSATDPLHVALAISWDRAGAADIIRRALVLLADHELNASTFATRVTVSTGAALSAGVLSGLATLSGPLHGGAGKAAQALGAEAKAIGAEAAVLARLGQGVPLPAFGHQLYPDGDIRAAALFGRFTPPEHFAALHAAATKITGERANIDFALAALTEAYDLPSDAPLVLFSLARCVGWLAHGLEQATSGQLIRPRAHYVAVAGDR
ncbi:citrate/2-methylcitrate synthase [Devosia sp. J2-20]|jgi:citrate synthase|uniref:citrate/2-methylcitrate synthase n=1 Tax=Devosia TaxID=46913 RepID=UPI0022AF52A7|nr:MULTISPECIES: citrate/2-methylcitrate synthase [Devosia]MCZ4345246.1 citrate synthase [Devosia neptuniae]WDQ98665.1 citrate/2-methylcitrate synthase [Devosia sp. J2-20]|tara:strand:- start:10380 stop:11513 length:1134 start_codon:yes stop_codon:yes gene_type:complete